MILMRKEAKNEAMLRLQQSKAQVINSFKNSLNNKERILSMEEVRKMLAEKLKGESLSEEIIQERDETDY